MPTLTDVADGRSVTARDPSTSRAVLAPAAQGPICGTDTHPAGARADALTGR